MLATDVRVDDIVYSGYVALGNDTLGCGLIDNHFF
jgi:hypothetical protein